MIREYRDSLEDMLYAIDKVAQFVDGMTFSEFTKDDKTLFAVIRALEIIGEAATKIPSSVRRKYRDIPWKEIIGMRNKLIHEYFGVKPRVVWKTIKKDLPDGRNAILS